MPSQFPKVETFDGGPVQIGAEIFAYLAWPDGKRERREFRAAVSRACWDASKRMPPPPAVSLDTQHGGFIHRPDGADSADIWRHWFGTDGDPGALALARMELEPDSFPGGIGPETVFAEANKRAPGWQTAGLLLRLILSMRMHHPSLRSASIRRARYVLEKWPGDVGGGVYRRDREVKAAWGKHRAVSHIAAGLMSVHAPGLTSAFSIACAHPLEVLAFAAAYQKFGRGHYQKHGGSNKQKMALFGAGTLLDVPRCYETRAAGVIADPGPLPPNLLDLAESYRAPV